MAMIVSVEEVSYSELIFLVTYFDSLSNISFEYISECFSLESAPA